VFVPNDALNELRSIAERCIALASSTADQGTADDLLAVAEWLQQQAHDRAADPGVFANTQLAPQCPQTGGAGPWRVDDRTIDS
jgi:hypothetical protein